MNPYFLNLVISFFVTAFCSLILTRWAPKLKLIDRPDRRKIHQVEKPVGGIALLIGFVPLAIHFNFFPPALLAGLLIVTLMGIVDDIQPLSPSLKLLTQILAASLPLLFILTPETSIGLPGVGSVHVTGWANIILISFWIVGATNALNLIDGLDGLATGIGLLVALFITFIGTGNDPSLAGALTGSLTAFLIYNFHPAKLFLGDGGSYFLGFLLAFSIIEFLGRSPAQTFTWPLIAGVIVLGLPISDTTWAIFRRAKKGRGIMSADKNHIHHLLLRKSDPKRAVIYLYIAQSFFCGLGFLYLYFSGYA